MTESNRLAVADIYDLAKWMLSDHQPVTIVMDRQGLFQLTAVIQLALRHPRLSDSIRSQMSDRLNELRSFMPEDIRRLSEAGDDPLLDVPVTGPLP